MAQLHYVVITPARNEEAFLGRTLASMASQTRPPLKWVVVSDGSTDRTDAMVEEYARQHHWIELLRMPPRTERDFAGKVGAFEAGRRQVTELPYDVIVSLDADLSFDPDYFVFLLGKLEADPQLGLVGTPFREDGRIYDYRYSSTEHVSGACQVFRRACYEQIGGYLPLPGGGIDSIAVLSARMHGWKTRTFTEKVIDHHRPMGAGHGGGVWARSYRLGQRAYRLGWHPLWQVFRSAYQMTRRPYAVAGAALFAGYFGLLLRGEPRTVGQDLIEFQRRDQMRRLRAALRLGPRT